MPAVSQAQSQRADDTPSGSRHDATAENAVDLVGQGRQIFRFDTFGDEQFWGDMLGLHKAIEGAAHGGVGPGLSPNSALTLGLKVDVDALPQRLLNRLTSGPGAVTFVAFGPTNRIG